MKFLIDRCAGQRLATWLATQGHDVRPQWQQEPDPGDEALLRTAAQEDRILVTIDSDFGTLVYLLVPRMPALSGCRTFPPPTGSRSWPDLLDRHGSELPGAIVTIRSGRIRISRRP